MSIQEQIKALLIAVDEAAATVLFTTGNDITISSRCGMALMDHSNGVYDPDGPHGIEAWALNALAAGLDDIQKNHCVNSILGDNQRAIDMAVILMPYVRVLTKVT